MGYFKDVTPESAGISSKGILNFLDRIEENQIELHSFMVVRHGKCAAKGWWKPYAPTLPHPLYSFGKTLTATAIGFARQEKILSYFVSIPNSFNCAGSTGLGACAIKSDALAVLGNATTSRMLSVPAKIIVKRSRPIPTPP